MSKVEPLPAMGLEPRFMFYLGEGPILLGWLVCCLAQVPPLPPSSPLPPVQVGMERVLSKGPRLRRSLDLPRVYSWGVTEVKLSPHPQEGDIGFPFSEQVWQRPSRSPPRILCTCVLKGRTSPSPAGSWALCPKGTTRPSTRHGTLALEVRFKYAKNIGPYATSQPSTFVHTMEATRRPMPATTRPRPMGSS